MKRILALVLALLMCLALVGCGAADTTEPQAEETAKTTEETAATTEETAGDILEQAVAAGEPDFEEGEYRIAVMMPLSGNFSFFSGYFKPILDYAVEKKNAEGGINGHKVTLIYKDDQGDASIEASALAEVLDEDVCAVIGPFMDTCGPVAAQWAEENKIPVVMCCGLATDVGMQYQSDYVFTAGSSPWAWAKIYANAMEEKGLTKAYFLAGVGGVPDNVYTYFWKEVEDRGLNIENVGEIRLSGDETDMTSVITSIMASGADVVFSSLTGGSAINFLQQSNQMGLLEDVTLFGVYINDSDHSESVGDAFPVGNVYSISWFPISFDFASDFAQEVYDMSDGVIPCSASLTFYYAFDTITQALASLDYEQGYDADAMVEAMSSEKFESVFGEVYYTDYSHQLVFPMYFANSQFSEQWNGYAMPDENDYVEYGPEVFPSEEEWNAEKEVLGY